MDTLAKDRVNPQYICGQCKLGGVTQQLPSPKNGAFPLPCICEGCKKPCNEVAELTDQKLAPDPDGPQVNKNYNIERGQRLANIFFDSKRRKFILAQSDLDLFKKKDKKKDKCEDEDGEPNLSDTYLSDSFKQVTSAPGFRKRKPIVDVSDGGCRVEETDKGCRIGGEEAKAVCDSLCIDE